MSKDMYAFMLENTSDLDEFFAEVLQDAAYRKIYELEMNWLAHRMDLNQSIVDQPATHPKVICKRA